MIGQNTYGTDTLHWRKSIGDAYADAYTLTVVKYIILPIGGGGVHKQENRFHFSLAL